MSRRRTLSNLNLARTPRFLVNLTAVHDRNIIKKEIDVESNMGFKAEINVAEEMNFDNAIAAINEAMEELRLAPVDHSVLFRILCQNLGDPIPKVIPPEAIAFTCNTLQRNMDLKINYPLLKKDWTEAFNEEAKKSKINEGKTLKQLGVRGSAFSLLAEELNKFGGFSKNFTQWDALSVLERSARKDADWIRCAEFCDAMKKSVLRVTKPSRMVGLRRTFSRDRLDRLIGP